MIKTLNRELGVTVVLVEQKLPFVRRTGDHFYILDRGAVKANGEVAELSEALVKEYLTV